MCGILGIFPGSRKQARTALKAIKHRGRDSSSVVKVEGGFLGHVLHAVVDKVKQPVKNKLVFNGEIYNWRQLAEQENIKAENDTVLLLELLERYKVNEVTRMIDGVFAFAYLNQGMVFLERDLLGVKPLWYADNFAFASEAKALQAAGFLPRELHPRTSLIYDIKKKKLISKQKKFEFSSSLDVQAAFQQSVKKRVPDNKRVAVLFSGGVDSSILAKYLSDLGCEVQLYVGSVAGSSTHDLLAAREAAKQLDLPLKEVLVNPEQVEQDLPFICNIIESSEVVKIGVALPFYYCCKAASVADFRVVFSGLGAEEVFAGYDRHKRALDINQECLRGLRMMFERDLYRDDLVSMTNTIELRLPFLDHELIAAGLAIPGEEKIVDGVTKMPLRNLATKLGLPESIALRKKKAAQYGSGFDKLLDKMAKSKNLRKSEFLNSIFPRKKKLAALLSGGKDSVYSLYTMQKLNFDIACVCTVVSENKDSYMYHTPLINVCEQQAMSMKIPFLSESTKGEKEKELESLKIILQRAVKEFKVDGVVSGALFSDYQRSRIENICEELGLQVFAPLWHLDQEQEVREILDAGFTFVMSRVAADGLDKSWVGKVISHEDVDLLTSKLGLNVAGEGGEYETLVVDGPNFHYSIDISNFKVVCERNGSSGDVCELTLQQ